MSKIDFLAINFIKEQETQAFDSIVLDAHDFGFKINTWKKAKTTWNKMT
jgi:hypothetical protein